MCKSCGASLDTNTYLISIKTGDIIKVYCKKIDFLVMAQVSAQKCSSCDENNGLYYCYECQHALCTVCHKRHGKIPALNGHTVANINTIDLSVVNKTNLCGTHEKEIQFYCTECIDLICIKCVTSTHKSHTISDITDVVKEERENAKENISNN